MCPLAALLALFWCTSRAAAQPEVDPPGYREAVEGAIAEFSAGNYPEAQTLFQRAHGLLPNARTLRGLGVVAFEQRSYTESARLLEAALASNERRLEGQLRRETENALARARMFIGQLDLSLSPEQSEVLVDGESVTVRRGEPLMLNVGTHTLEFHAPGHRSQRRKVQTQGMTRVAWNVQLQPSASESTRTEAPAASERSTTDGGPAAPRSRLGVAKWLSAGGALATTGVTVFAVVIREQRARTVESCADDLDCSNSVASGNRWKRAAIGTGSVAGALVVATVALFIADRRGSASMAHGCTLDGQLRGVGCWTAF